MGKTVFLNGTYLDESEAKVSIFDRGYVFGDGAYEVTTVLDGKLVDSPRHQWRLEKSLAAIDIPLPLPWEEIEEMQRELVRRNGLDQGLVYFQITRGVADRRFSYNPGLVPTLSAFTQTLSLDPDPLAQSGVKVVTCPDLRWKRRDIKSISLLSQVMAKQVAKQAGAFEAFMVEDGLITEGSSTSAFIITDTGQLIVRPSGGTDILPGLTCFATLELVEQGDLVRVERAFSPQELYTAREAFLTSATNFIMPIVEADGQRIGGGTPGAMTLKLRQRLIEAARANLS